MLGPQITKYQLCFAFDNLESKVDWVSYSQHCITVFLHICLLASLLQVSRGPHWPQLQRSDLDPDLPYCRKLRGTQHPGAGWVGPEETCGVRAHPGRKVRGGLWVSGFIDVSVLQCIYYQLLLWSLSSAVTFCPCYYPEYSKQQQLSIFQIFIS